MPHAAEIDFERRVVEANDVVLSSIGEIGDKLRMVLQETCS